MKLIQRQYQAPDDYWRIRAFLRDAIVQYGYRERCWPPYRFDYWAARMYDQRPGERIDDLIYLWETPDQELAAVLLTEGKGEAFLNVLPQFRSPDLDREMLALAEERLARILEDGRRKLYVWVNTAYTDRQQLLLEKGYHKGSEPEHQRRRSMELSIPDHVPPPGFTVRSLGAGLELLERCYASGLGFHNNDIRIAVDNREDVTWYQNIQFAPLYRRDLDIVAVAPTGAVAAFCTVWFDDVALTGAFEPVATVPAFQRMGLGKAVMAEGLRRLKRMGARWSYVSSFSPGAHALYSSMGFTDFELQEPWSRTW